MRHFVHHLSEKQCKEYTKIGTKNDKSIINYFSKCRDVANNWISKPPKLGRYRKNVEMDESHFAGAPKYGKGRRLGGDATFGLTERCSRDCVLKAVDASRSRKTLFPIINENCNAGTVCKVSWKAYYQLL